MFSATGLLEDAIIHEFEHLAGAAPSAASSSRLQYQTGPERSSICLVPNDAGDVCFP